MVAYLLRRLLQWIPVLLFSSIVVFAAVRAMPGDPAELIAGPEATREEVQLIRAQYGLDRSLPVQYAAWLTHMTRGDFGVSYIYHRDNRELIFSRLPFSLLIAATALLSALAVGVPLGLAAGLGQGKTIDWIASLFASLAIATPNFWFGMLGILLFAVKLGWLPPGGFIGIDDSVSGFLLALVLPTLTLGLHGAAVLMRATRGAVIDTLGEGYIRTARAKGLGRRRIVYRHVLRNSLLPIATMAGMLLGRMLGGAVVIESVFAWPGIGRLLVQSIINQDYGMVQGILIVLVLVFLVINLLVDLLYGAIDPRIRLVREER